LTTAEKRKSIPFRSRQGREWSRRREKGFASSRGLRREASFLTKDTLTDEWNIPRRKHAKGKEDRPVRRRVGRFVVAGARKEESLVNKLRESHLRKVNLLPDREDDTNFHERKGKSLHAQKKST